MLRGVTRCACYCISAYCLPEDFSVFLRITLRGLCEHFCHEDQVRMEDESLDLIIIPATI